MHPKVPELGRRSIVFGRNILIERDDYADDPPSNFFRLKPGGEVRLRFGYVIRCDEVIRDADGRPTELQCSHYPETRQGAGKKVKGIIHWLPEEHCVRGAVRLYDRLFTEADPGAGHADGDFLRDLNQNSLVEFRGCAMESYVSELKPGAQLQFERTGFFSVDKDSRPDNLLLNRITTLKDTWAKKA